MKNQYFGDINDYRKYGLLRMLSGSRNIRIGVCWMLTEDDDKRDGGLTKYLSNPQKWRAYDEELFDKLTKIFSSGASRNVSVAEEQNLIPSAVYYSDILKDDREQRSSYFKKYWKVVSDVDLIFFDPDNGIQIKTISLGRKRSSKYLFWSELTEMYLRGLSVIYYQHFPHVEREPYIRSTFKEISYRTGAKHICSLSTSYVAFFMLIQPMHKIIFRPRISELTKKWGGQFKISWG